MALPGNKNFSDYDNYITDPNPTTSAQAQDYFRNQAELLKAVIDCDFWQPETVYQPGDVVKSDSMPKGTEAVMVATKASVTSNVEPQWGAVGGANISDGACFWKLRYKATVTEEMADYPLRNKAYSLNAIVACPYHAEYFLKCTQAGTTSTDSLDTTSATLDKVYTDGGVKWMVINFHVASLPEGVVSLRQYGIQENTDISSFLNNLIANESVNKILLPQGTFNIDTTVNVNRAVVIEGAGGTKTKFKVTCQTGFFVTTNFKPPFTLTDIGFIGTDTNTLIEANRGSWGACFVIKNFSCQGFQYFCVAKSAYGVLVENGRILSNCKIRFEPYNDTMDASNFSNVNKFERVYYTGYPNKSPYVFEFKHVDNMIIDNCVIEKTEVVFKNEASSEMVVVNKCWFEQNDYLIENVSDKGEFLVSENTAYNFLTYEKGATNSYLGGEHFKTYVKSNLETDNAGAYGVLLKNEPVVFFARRVEGNGFNIPLVRFDTNKGEIAVPVNIYKEVKNGVSETTLDLWRMFYYAGIRMLYTVYFCIWYSDTSAAIYKAEVFSRNYQWYKIAQFEKVQKSSWSNASAEEDCTLKLTDKSITFASPNSRAFSKLEIVVEYKPLSASVV